MKKEYGTYLKEEREKRKISIAKVCKDTRIAKSVLLALENMHKEEFPSDVYLKGFIKLYAEYLKLDPQEVIKMFEENVISETPIEFDIINIKKKKKEPRNMSSLFFMSIILVGIMGVGGWFFVKWAQSHYGSEFFVHSKKKNEKENAFKKNGIQTIEGIYENTFSAHQKATLIKEKVRAQFNVKSVEPAVIIVDGKQYTLKKGVPQKVLLPDGKVYIIILRKIDLLQNKLQLRFDPRVNANIAFVPDGVSEKDIIQLPSEEVKSDGVITVLKTTTHPETIQLVMKSNGEGLYYRYETPNDQKEGILSSSIVVEHNDYIDVYLSNPALSDITINNIKLPSFPDSLPVVFRLTWKIKGNKALLEFIPIP